MLRVFASSYGHHIDLYDLAFHLYYMSYKLGEMSINFCQASDRIFSEIIQGHAICHFKTFSIPDISVQNHVEKSLYATAAQN